VNASAGYTYTHTHFNILSTILSTTSVSRRIVISMHIQYHKKKAFVHHRLVLVALNPVLMPI